MNTTAVQVIRWLTRIFNAFIALMMVIISIGSMFEGMTPRISPLGLLVIFTFLYGTVLAYKREGLAGLLMLATWVIAVIDAVFTLRGEVASEVLFRVILEQSIPFLLMGTMYIVCWWQSKNLQPRDVVLPQ